MNYLVIVFVLKVLDMVKYILLFLGLARMLQF